MLTSFLIQLCKIEKTVVKKSLILEIFPGPRLLMPDSLEKRFITQKPTRSKNPFACCNCWHVLPFSLLEWILLHLFPWQKDSQDMLLRTPVAPSEHQIQLMGFSSLSWMILCWMQWCQAQGEAPKWSLLLPSPGAALEACESSWSPPHLGTLRESRAQPAKP